ncbi:WD domain, G-beta repeat protein [Gregarina niphandrodes]|uniref:WD domain, G-beta repeat protein n=1 Tax=Gregarina niphandrodes TaxID=110365 RepID=A0A023B1G4_GRENI|nr:WD domain, G-beta repeat protein [Gregarina niphandrodes]EZG46745.1 WD domain, G-beta repeat protein [Gregarina niphandrodes]|eukprot:XP_011132254.1 WD domain, G-beta repeat protein [Gregarina niphandrodes]
MPPYDLHSYSCGVHILLQFCCREVLRYLVGPGVGLTTWDVHRDLGYIVGATDKGVLGVCRWTDETFSVEVEAHRKRIDALVCVAGTPLVVTSGRDGVTRVWKLEPAEPSVLTPVCDLVGHSNWVVSVRNTGDVVTSVSDDGLMISWDPETWRPVSKVRLRACNRAWLDSGPQTIYTLHNGQIAQYVRSGKAGPTSGLASGPGGPYQRTDSYDRTDSQGRESVLVEKLSLSQMSSPRQTPTLISSPSLGPSPYGTPTTSPRNSLQELQQALVRDSRATNDQLVPGRLPRTSSPRKRPSAPWTSSPQERGLASHPTGSRPHLATGPDLGEPGASRFGDAFNSQENRSPASAAAQQPIDQLMRRLSSRSVSFLNKSVDKSTDRSLDQSLDQSLEQSGVGGLSTEAGRGLTPRGLLAVPGPASYSAVEADGRSMPSLGPRAVSDTPLTPRYVPRADGRPRRSQAGARSSERGVEKEDRSRVEGSSVGGGSEEAVAPLVRTPLRSTERRPRRSTLGTEEGRRSEAAMPGVRKSSHRETLDRRGLSSASAQPSSVAPPSAQAPTSSSALAPGSSAPPTSSALPGSAAPATSDRSLRYMSIQQRLDRELEAARQQPSSARSLTALRPRRSSVETGRRSVRKSAREDLLKIDAATARLMSDPRKGNV